MEAKVDHDPRVGASGSTLAAIRRWLAANTLSPRWLVGRWQHPAISYLAAIAVELAALAVVVLLVQTVPHFQFPEALLLLALVLDGLTWGAAPALLATVVGAALLDLLVIPPIFSLALDHVEDTAGVILFLVVGVILSLVTGQTERTRRETMGLARMLAGERTRLAQAERVAASQASEMEAIFEAMTDGVYVNEADGRLAHMNAAGRALAGLDAHPKPPDLTAASLGSAMAPRDTQGQPLPFERWPLTRVLAGEVLTGDEMADLLVRTLDGQERHVSINGAPVRDAEGRIVRAVTVVRDVTEQRRLERRTREALEALRESNRRMDEFLSIAAHELRSPLTGIKGNTQLALRRLQRGQDAATVAEMLERAEGQVDRLTRLIGDLLDVSRIQSGHLDLHLGDADLVAVARRCVEEQRLSWPARTITLDAPGGALPVWADADRLAQVIGNYLTNALKYSPPDQPVAVTVAAHDRAACVRVRDHGAGLTPEQQAVIWDRYQRVQGVHVRDDTGGSGGLGLGLYISRTIVEAHGGRVGVESAPGQGATFWCQLPLTRPDGD